MSLIRIIAGVVVGGCIVAGMLAAAVRFPTVAMFLMCGTAGIALLAVAYHGLQKGVIGPDVRGTSAASILSVSGFTWSFTRSLAW
jgi:hypothetical protein